MTLVMLGQTLPDWANNFLMPIWLLGLGALLGILVLLVVWAIAFGVGLLPGCGKIRMAAHDAPRIVQEGPMAFLSLSILAMAGFGVLGFALMRDSLDIVESLRRLPVVGEVAYREQVEATPRDELGEADAAKEATFPVEVNRRELDTIQIQSSENVLIYSKPFEEGVRREGFDVAAGIPFNWSRNSSNIDDFPEGMVTELYVVNRGNRPADISMVVNLRPANPEVRHIVITAVCVVVVTLLYFVLAVFMPRLSAIALATFKSEVAAPMFLILVGLGGVGLAIFVILPYNTLGEDIKMLKDNGLTLIMLFGMLQAVWAAGTSVSEEVEGRTALTVLSKPITRRSFIIGKYVGILWTVLLLFVLLGLWFLTAISYKVIYDAKENSTESPVATVGNQFDRDEVWQVCHQEVAETVPGLALGFLETAVMASLAVAISTRLPLLANMVICLSIYVLGHLTPVLVSSSGAAQQFEIVVFAAQFIATVLPNLESFNVAPAVAGGVEVPWSYLVMALLYSLVYSLIAMFLALFLFEDRDLA